MELIANSGVRFDMDNGIDGLMIKPVLSQNMRNMKHLKNNGDAFLCYARKNGEIIELSYYKTMAGAIGSYRKIVELFSQGIKYYTIPDNQKIAYKAKAAAFRKE